MNKKLIDKVKEKVDIFDLANRLGLSVNKSNSVSCYNPHLHKNGDIHPSLSLDKNRNKFKCFACGESGSVIDLIKGYKKLDFNKAVNELAKMYGITNITTKPKVVARYEYKYKEGKTLYIKERVEPGRDGKDKEFFFKHQKNGKWVKGRGCEPVLYNSQEVIEAKVVFFVEGEAKVEHLRKWGIAATCLDAGANSQWKSEYNKYIDGKDEILILPDNDKPGRAYASMIANAVHEKVGAVKMIALPGLPEKGDIIDWEQLPGNYREKFLVIIKSTPKFNGEAKEEFSKLIENTQIIEAEDTKQEQCETTMLQIGDYYFDDDSCLYRNKLTSKGVVIQKLANFDARIKSEVIKDDGVEQTIIYIIDCKLKNTILPQVEVLAEKFASMNWLHHLGTRAIIEPGASIKDCVRHYIQSNSNAMRHTCFTHTGWRQIDNDWVYLTGNGAIGAENVSVELSRELQRYNLPLETICKEKETESILAGLSFLDIGKKEITCPLYAITHLAPLTTILNPMPNFSAYLLGGTGLYKTTISGVCLSFFGDFGSISTLPNFSDTANSIEMRSFTLKDTLMVLDDYHPSAQKAEALKTENTAQRIIRAYSNRTGRGRLNANSTDKGRHEPRGMLLITGEDLVTLQSTLARVAVVEVSNGGIYKDKLTEIQGKLDSLPCSMASYISWIRDNINTIKDGFPKRFKALRAEACREGMHNKLPEQVAYLAFSIETVCLWLIAQNVIDEKRAKEIFEEAWDVFINQALLQSRRINNENPVQKFIDILQTLITQGKVKLVPKGRMEKSCNGGNIKELGGDHGEMIGYFDDQYCYLLSTAMWRTIQMFCKDEGGHFPMSKNLLYKMLNDQGLVKGGKGGENTILIKIESKTIRVLALSRKAISGHG